MVFCLFYFGFGFCLVGFCFCLDGNARERLCACLVLAAAVLGGKVVDNV